MIEEIIAELREIKNQIADLQTQEATTEYRFGATLPTAGDYNGQLYFRTSDRVLWNWNSTLSRWQSDIRYLAISCIDNAISLTNTSGIHVQRLPNDYDIYIYDIEALVYIVTTNNSTNYWTIGQSLNSNTVNTSSISPNVNTPLSIAMNGIITHSNNFIQTIATKVGSPGAFDVYGYLMKYAILA